MSATFLGIDFAQKGLSLYTVPAVWFLSMVPHAYALSAAGKSVDPAYPREITDRVNSDQSLDKRTKQRITRALAAESNTLETLGFLAGGVVAANAAGVDAGLTNALSFGILGVRAAYVFLYVVLQEDRNLAPVRSLLWLAKQAGISALYVLAARAYSIWPN